MRIVSRGMAITLAALSLTGGALAAPVETVLYSFKGGTGGGNFIGDGNFPAASLIADAQGALYGTSVSGGSGNVYGTVFKLTPPAKGQTAWTEIVLHSFTGGIYTGRDGQAPFAGLIADEQGALYGTTYYGGSGGAGTVFKLTPPATGQTAWTETVLYSFGSFGGSNGAQPKAGLIFDTQGALYGTTEYGGSGSEGTVFKLTPPATGQTAWTETVLHSFIGGSDGSSPVAGLIFDAQGALYGTTLQNGSNGSVNGYGTVFKLTPPATGQTAWTPATLYSFCSLPNCTDGFAPLASLIFDEQGALYGTTTSGGSGQGTVFKLTPPATGKTVWTETVLYNLGNFTLAGLIFDEQGALYGTTFEGGSSSNGTVFKLTPPKGRSGWKETVLHSFSGSTNDGAGPKAGLIVDKRGALYGTTYYGGSEHCLVLAADYGCGTVFKLPR